MTAIYVHNIIQKFNNTILLGFVITLFDNKQLNFMENGITKEKVNGGPFKRLRVFAAFAYS